MKKLHRKILSVILSVLMTVSVVTSVSAQSYTHDTETASITELNVSNEEVFLSDISGTALIKSSVGYGNLMFDKNIEGDQISLKVNGKRFYFDKGLGAHAPSKSGYDQIYRISRS